MDYSISEGYNELYLTMYGDGRYYDKNTLWYRIKHSFKILCGGEIYGGDLILTEDKAIELKVYIEEFLNKIK